MASRPLPPGRRGRGARATPVLHLPDVKILSDASSVPTTSSYAEKLRAQQPAPSAALVVEPEHESTTKETEYEPAPVRSVKAFVSSLEKAQDPVAAVLATPAAAAGEDAPPPARAPVLETSYAPPPASPQAAEEKPAPPVVVHAATTPKKPVVPPRVQQVHAPPPPVQVVAAPPPVTTPAPFAVRAAAPAVNAPVLEGFHPFNALLPIYSVPDIPETVDCVFDDAALEMQKNVMKVIKKVFGKDRTKLEDFKINSRLFGNNFMDPLEYVEALVKDLGGNRALLLVPCLVSIQPDFMKRSSMLVAARNYRLRNLSKLEAALDKVEVEAPASMSAPVEHTEPKMEVTSVAVAAPVAAAAVVTHEVLLDAVQVVPEEDVTVQETSSVMDVVQEQPPQVDAEVLKPSHPIEDHCYAEEPADVFVPTAEEVASVPAIESVSESTPFMSEPVLYAVSEPLAYVLSEPQSVEAVLVEPTAPSEAPSLVWERVTEPVGVEQLHKVPDSTVSPASVEAVVPEAVPSSHPEPITAIPGVALSDKTAAVTPHGAEKVESTETFITVDTTISSESSSVSSAPVTPSASSPVHHQPVRRKSTISLFGEEIADDDDEDDDDDKEEEDVKTIVTTPSVVAPAATPDTTRIPSPEPTPASSFYEAESLFGEVLPVVVKPAAESPIPTPAPATSLLKPPPARTGMLFGFASAGGDSDSDSDSEFSD